MTDSVVITGDLIQSTAASPAQVDRALAALAAAADQITLWAGEDTRFTRFRGDGWQIHIARPALLLRSLLLLMAGLRASGTGLDTRLSVAIGQVDRLGDSGLAGATGQAFTLSGRNLDEMLAFRTLVLAEPGQLAPSWRRAVLDLAHWQASQWTREQAEAAALALQRPRPSDAALAASLGISRQAFQARLKGSGLMAQSAALAAFEASHDWGDGEKDD